jgi:hypothetical protein
MGISWGLYLLCRGLGLSYELTEVMDHDVARKGQRRLGPLHLARCESGAEPRS